MKKKFKRASKGCGRLSSPHRPVSPVTSRTGLAPWKGHGAGCQGRPRAHAQHHQLRTRAQQLPSISSLQNEDPKISLEEMSRSPAAELQTLRPAPSWVLTLPAAVPTPHHLENKVALPCFVHEERKAQLGEDICPGLHNWWVRGPGLTPGPPRCQPSLHCSSPAPQPAPSLGPRKAQSPRSCQHTIF